MIEKEKPTLNARQILFCKEYLVDLNASRAALAAGYSKHTAPFIGAENLKKPQIKEHLKILMKPREEKLEISIEWVLKNLIEVSQRCMQKVPVMYFDKEDKEYKQETTADGEGVWEFDANGANRALELIGKHLGMFVEPDKDKKDQDSFVFNFINSFNGTRKQAIAETRELIREKLSK